MGTKPRDMRLNQNTRTLPIKKPSHPRSLHKPLSHTPQIQLKNPSNALIQFPHPPLLIRQSLQTHHITLSLTCTCTNVPIVSFHPAEKIYRNAQTQRTTRILICHSTPYIRSDSWAWSCRLNSHIRYTAFTFPRHGSSKPPLCLLTLEIRILPWREWIKYEIFVILNG